MLYIKKAPPPAEYLRAVASIKSTSAWRCIPASDTPSIRDTFDTLPKASIRMALLEEQHHLCAYCMKRIRNEELHMNIEHQLALSKDKEKALDYNNFLGVCKGGANATTTNNRPVLCCDASKGSHDLRSLDPLNIHIMQHIVYNTKGVISFAPPAGWDDKAIQNIAEDINTILCLNGRQKANGELIADTSTELVKGRRDAWKAAQQIIIHFARKGQLTVSQIESYIQKTQAKSEWPEFAGTIFYWLRRKQKSLAAQKKAVSP